MIDKQKYATARRAGLTAVQAVRFARNSKGAHFHGMWVAVTRRMQQRATIARAILRMDTMGRATRFTWQHSYHAVRHASWEHRSDWQRREVERDDALPYIEHQGV
jgi:hypothetical protein